MSSIPTVTEPAPEAVRVWGYVCSKQAAPQNLPRPPSRTTSLPFKQAKELINALAFAERLLPGDTPWAHVTLALEQSEVFDPDPRAYLTLQGRILHRVGDWLRGQGLPTHYLWVREIGPRYGHQHTHVLLPLPPELSEDLEALLYRVGRLHDLPNNRAVVVQLNRLHGNKGIATPASRAGVMRDFLKTMSPKAKLQGTPIMPALGIDNRGQKPCPIHGKRSGTSANLGRATRAASGWKELEAVPELRAALPTGAEARRERNRRKQRRYRARKASTLPPPTPPARARGTDPFDVTGLDTDFLAPLI